MYNVFWLLLVMLLAIGCVPTADQEHTEEIPKGSAPKNPFEGIATARISLDESAGICSGALVTENLILTAGHCFDAKGGKIPKAVAVSLVKLDGSRLNLASGQIIESGAFFPTETHFKDIGYVKLAPGHTAGVGTLALATGVHTLPAATSFSFFGHASSTWADMKKNSWEPDPAAIAVTLADWKKWTLVTDLTSTCAIAAGDSGGPLLLKKQDQWLIVGVLQGPGDAGHYTFTPAENALTEIAAKAGTSAKTLVAH